MHFLIPNFGVSPLYFSTLHIIYGLPFFLRMRMVSLVRFFYACVEKTGWFTRLVNGLSKRQAREFEEGSVCLQKTPKRERHACPSAKARIWHTGMQCTSMFCYIKSIQFCMEKSVDVLNLPSIMMLVHVAYVVMCVCIYVCVPHARISTV